jgi:hypothetical protein
MVKRQKVSLVVKNTLQDAYFADERTGWLLVETSHALERLFIADRDHIWAVGFGGVILRLGEPSAPQLKP